MGGHLQCTAPRGVDNVNLTCASLDNRSTYLHLDLIRAIFPCAADLRHEAFAESAARAVHFICLSFGTLVCFHIRDVIRHAYAHMESWLLVAMLVVCCVCAESGCV